MLGILAPKREHRIGLMLAAIFGGCIGLCLAVSYVGDIVPYYDALYAVMHSCDPHITYTTYDGCHWNDHFYWSFLSRMTAGAVIAATLACIARLMRS
jgi:hypothetical protein